MVVRNAACLVLFAVGMSCSVYDVGLLGSVGGGGQGVDATAGAAAQAGSAPQAGAGAAVGASAGAGGRFDGGSGSGGLSGSSVGAQSGAPSLGGAADGGETGHVVVEPLPTGAGAITYERWSDVPGSGMGDFPWDAAPTEARSLDVFRAPPSADEEYAVRLQGYITAPLDGKYRFWIACDDNCELWLSTDETLDNEVRIASLLGVERWTEPDDWSKYASQESALVTLQAGQRYRVEAVMKQGLGGSNLSVGWLKPGQSGAESPAVIPGSQLSPIE